MGTEALEANDQKYRQPALDEPSVSRSHQAAARLVHRPACWQRRPIEMPKTGWVVEWVKARGLKSERQSSPFSTASA